MNKVLHWLQFNLWYFRQPPWDTGVTPPEVIAFLQHTDPGRALDLGCGTGTNSLTLAKYGWKVTGIDFVWQAIRLARQKTHRAGYQSQVDLHTADVTQLDFLKQLYDFILDIGCLHSIPFTKRSVYFDTVDRLLKPSGIYMLYAFFQEGENQNGLRSVDSTELKKRFLLTEYTEGMERNIRRSSWFTFQKS